MYVLHYLIACPWRKAKRRFAIRQAIMLFLLILLAALLTEGLETHKLKVLLPLTRWLTYNWDLGSPDIYVRIPQESNNEDELLDILHYQRIPYAQVLFSSPKTVQSKSSFTLVTDPAWKAPPYILHGAWLIPESARILPQNLRFDSKVYLYHISDANTITVLEKYVTKEGTKNQQVNDVGVWNCSNHSFKYLAEQYIWDRRTNLHLETLSGIYVPTFNQFAYMKKDGTISGVFVALARSMATSLNFSLKLEPQPDGKWGTLGKDGTWNGMMGSLVEKKADLTISALGITSERKNAVDFMETAYEGQVTLMAHDLSKRKAIILTRYFDAFTPQAWFAIVLFALLCGAILSPSVGKQWSGTPFSIQGLVIVSHLLIFQRGYSATLETKSGNFSYFIACLFSFIIFASYSGLLTATMIGKHAEVDLVTMDNVADSDSSLYIWEDAFTFMKFQAASPKNPWGKVYKRKIKEKENIVFVRSYKEIYEKLSNDPNAIYIGGDTLLAIYQDVYRVHKFRDFIPMQMSICLQKDSEYRESFNYYLRKLDQSGIRYKTLSPR